MNPEDVSGVPVVFMEIMEPCSLMDNMCNSSIIRPILKGWLLSDLDNRLNALQKIRMIFITKMNIFDDNLKIIDNFGGQFGKSRVVLLGKEITVWK